MLQNAMVTALIVSEISRENQGEEGGLILRSFNCSSKVRDGFLDILKTYEKAW